MEYQLELANKTIEELKGKLLETEQQLVTQETNKLSKYELQDKQIERWNDEIAQLHRKQEQVEHELRQKVNIIRLQDEQCFQYETYLGRIEQQLKESYFQIDDQCDYIRNLEEKLASLDEENLELIQQNKTLLKDLEYQKKFVQSQIHQIKAEYEMKVIQKQEKLIQLSRTPNKENIVFSQNTSFIDQGKESRTSKQSSSDQLFELQNELNKNIKLLNQKLKTYK